MPMFNVSMRCTYTETWAVEAKDAEEARKLCADLDESVITDEAGECVDWQVVSVAEDKHG